MSLLRHPVVITSLEEDLRKIGIIPENRLDEEVNSQEVEDAEDVIEASDDNPIAIVIATSEKGGSGYRIAVHKKGSGFYTKVQKAGTTKILPGTRGKVFKKVIAQTVQSLPGSYKVDRINHMSEEEQESSLDYDFEGDEGADFDLTQEEMDELEGMAESVETLQHEEVELEEEDDEDFEEEDDDVEEAPTDSFESVAGALRDIETLISEDSEEISIENAVPAFAEMALLAEKLYEFYVEMSLVEEDGDYVEIADIYEKVARYADGVVSTLQEEDADTIDPDALKETFQDYLGTLLEGIETYAILREAEDMDEDEEDEEDGEEQEEGKE